MIMRHRFINTLGPEIPFNKMIYIYSSNDNYTKELIILLESVYIYKYIILDGNINIINNDSILILCNIPVNEAIIYSIVAEQCNSQFIYLLGNNNECNIVNTFTYDIEKEYSSFIFNKQILPCVISMQCSYIVISIIKYHYKIGTVSNFKWYDNDVGIDIKLYKHHNSDTINLYSHVNKLKSYTQLIIPFVTDKSICIKDTKETYNICTIENNPTKIEHLVEWAKGKYKQYDKPTFDIFMKLFNDNILNISEFYPERKLVLLNNDAPYYNDFINSKTEMEWIFNAVNLRALNYNINTVDYDTVVDIYNNIKPTIIPMLKFTESFAMMEMYKNKNHYTWEIDMEKNIIKKHPIEPAKIIEINGCQYNEWFEFTYNNIDASFQDMLIDINIMYSTHIELIMYNTTIIYSDFIEIDMDMDIKTLIMDKCNIDISKESITLQIIGMDMIQPGLIITPRIN